MSKSLETVWALEPHTAKKHEILRRYFQAWLPILGRYNSRLLYIDAFAGPGEYTGGEDGSPVLILKAARDHALKLKARLLCLFVESEVDRYQHLIGVLDRLKTTLPGTIEFHALHGKFTDYLAVIFAEVDRAPTLAFVDPFGYSQTPFTVVTRLLRYPKSEVLVNFMYEEINRFLSVPERAAHFDALFGTTKWRDIVPLTDPNDRLCAIHDLYLEQLRTAAKYVRAFLMVNETNSADYFLFFATNSLDGLEQMKIAMWKADPSGEFQFSDFTDAKKQLPLFAAGPDYALLRDLIVYQWESTAIDIRDLGDWVVAETPFLRSHIKKHILIPLEKEGKLTVESPKPGRKQFTYPDGTVIRFR